MKLLNGDCQEILRDVSSNSVDSVVTDPPYGLSFMGKKWDYDVPSIEIWKEVLRVLKPGGHILSFGGTRTYHRMVVNIEDAGFEIRDQIQWLYGSGFPKSHNGDHGGTALKPANEPIVLARKPLDGTVAQNFKKWGVGGLNIDLCRIELNGQPNPSVARYKSKPQKGNNGWEHKNRGALFDPEAANLGRWPANVIIGCDCEGTVHGQLCMIHLLDQQTEMEASRFFYCAKVSKKERGDKNDHPTLKAIKLMTYLIKLITPPQGTVLDPFMGSGSTGIAAKKEGFEFIGIEKEQEYFKIAEKRIESCLKTNLSPSAEITA